MVGKVAAGNHDTPPTYGSVVDELINHFTAIDKAAGTLPLFTAMPLLRFLWASVKLYFALIGDFILIIPINFVTLIRNIFPGRWRYTCWSCKYFRAVLMWLWNGECVVPSIFIRPLSNFLLHWHFRSRLSALRRRIVVETLLSEEDAKAALAKIDRAQAVWGTTSFGSIILAWVIPLTGPGIEVAKLLVPDLPGWSTTVVVFIIGYVLGVLATAFHVNRGLMMGASGREAFYPGFISGAGGYERERQILQPVGLALSEFPLDAALIVASAILGLITYRTQMEFARNIASIETGMLGGSTSVPDTTMWPFFISLLIWPIILVIALVRRKRLGRS
jgi:hypothetical protein